MRSLAVTTTAAGVRFATVPQLKLRLGISTSSHDDILGEILDETTDVFGRYCNRTFPYQVYSEQVGIENEQFHILLSNFPIASSTVTVTYLPYGTSGTTAISSTGYQVLNDRGALYASTGWWFTGAAFGGVALDLRAMTARPAFTVAYGAGYDLTTSGDLGVQPPLDLRSAALQTASAWWNSLPVAPTAGAFDAIGLEELSVTFRKTQVEAAALGELPSAVERLLGRYVVLT